MRQTILDGAEGKKDQTILCGAERNEDSSHSGWGREEQRFKPVGFGLGIAK